MTDHEPTSTQVSSLTTQLAPANADSGSPPSSASVKEAQAVHNSSSSPKADDADASGGANGIGKDSPKDEKKINGKDGGDNPGDAKPKRTTPYLNKDRFKTGGSQRDKPSPEELAERMERIRLNNEKIKERRAAVQADEQAFEASQAEQRAKAAAQRKVQAGIDASRAVNAKRKMEKVGVREWDSFKKGAGAGTNASMNAPPAAPAPNLNENANASVNTNETKEGSPAPASEQTRAQAASAGSESERGRGRGRGAGRTRSRGRGARGGGRGGGESDPRREKAPHIKDAHGADAAAVADWGAAAEEWGTATATNTDDSQTGIAITTNEADLWGPAPGDDPWGAAPATNEGQKS